MVVFLKRKEKTFHFKKFTVEMYELMCYHKSANFS